MTAAKKPKKQKLRNAEYYNLQETFDKLYLDSKNGRIFTKLMPVILSEQNIRLAYRNLKKNSGSRTAGTDKKTIKDLEICPQTPGMVCAAANPQGRNPQGKRENPPAGDIDHRGQADTAMLPASVGADM